MCTFLLGCVPGFSSPLEKPVLSLTVLLVLLSSTSPSSIPLSKTCFLLKKQRLRSILSQLWGLDVQSPGVFRAMFLLDVLSPTWVFLSSHFSVPSQCPLACDSITSVFSSLECLFLCVSDLPLVSYKNSITLNPNMSEIFNLISSAKIIF